ncbi:hypothetical protein DK847_18500 [Aestuariivirga litoralis]|uniref:Uncharacterized protein n=1 Tax=Aestuariivirga litoralis TaxID=2650924 RepID=A0A2W2AJ77_9HYPH|nr:Imm8 family immunity protein [Aestuariivirga litoralis]PZF75505.1 hypothetical protein DK847_18500 [Aestuariivirga litoralis]
MGSIKIKYFEIYPNLWARNDYGWTELAEWVPSNPEDFDVFLYIGIGPADDEGADTFHLTIMSRRHYDGLSPEQKRTLRTRWKYFVVERYDWPVIWREINHRISNCDRGNWADSLAELRQQFTWEFENYNKPSPPEMH